MTTPGEPNAATFGRHLANLEAEDGSVWTFDPTVGGFVTTDERHADVIAMEAAAVAFHVGGPDGTVRQAREQG